MAQHISIRVPWHDNGWNGTVCSEPTDNNACLRLKNIYENRNDIEECKLCGECMVGHEDKLPCIGEGAAFMSGQEHRKITVHPYKKNNKETHGHFRETEVVYPEYSFPARPFAWMMSDRIQNKANIYGIDYNPAIEPQLGWKNNWVQEAANHRAIFDCFYQDIIPDKSICIAYAKQVPFIEDSRRVVVGMGFVKKIIPAVEHNHTDEKPLRSMTWETMICHSIRENHEDGFVIPYQQMMEYAKEHPEFDMSTITVFAPDDAFEEFSYASEHVSHDAVIEVTLSCIKAFEIIQKCLDEDYSNVLAWLNARLDEVWEDRGAFPGLGPMLCAFGIELGVVIAKRIKDILGSKTGEDRYKIWELVDAIINNPEKYLEDMLASKITPIIKKTWKALSDERRCLFELLSRFALTIDQATVLYNEEQRYKYDITCFDKEIIENPYILYEKTRLKFDEIRISVKKVDRAVFPVASIQEKYPLQAPTKLTSDNDERRIRAVAVAVMEYEAECGNTILPCDMLINKINDWILKPACSVTRDILNAIKTFASKELMQREMKDGSEYYKLVRIHEFDNIIETKIRKRIKGKLNEVNVDWKQVFKEFQDKNKKEIVDPIKQQKALEEKSACLKMLAESRISVMVGDAGTGKTTVLSVLCSEPSIKAGGILLLAPTGKATVRLLESMGENAKNCDAMNIAQFLTRGKRFDTQDFRYKLAGNTNIDNMHKTIIVDEASMLTEEMFGAVMESVGVSDRIIFVGDPNQLPPIGAGKPFVDLVNLLKDDVKKGSFPQVGNNYGKLMINHRQDFIIERQDVKLYKCFTNTEEKIEDDIITKIVLGDNENISFEKWETKEELESKILKVLNDIDVIKDENDIDGFNKSLGGKKADFATFFNMGSAEYASKWQILAPVRNMPQGVMNINRFIHERFREFYINVSHKTGYNRCIPKAFGPEKIVYGDKIINVINKKRDAWPKENAKNYVANGEIGIACTNYGKKYNHDYLHVEFSTQKGFTYSYDYKDFNDEQGTETLELAYALTVHKAQGSQFDTVILVIAEPCRIISREMLYTALTRQFDKIVILYNKEPHELMKYISPEYSDIARRFTDLFANVFPDKDTRPQLKEHKGTFYDENLVHITVNGEMVRSKSELIIANALYYKNIVYEYEPVLELDGRRFRPDFKIVDADSGIEWYWEHCGVDTEEYKKRWADKKAYYDKHGIREGENLIVTYDENGGLDSGLIDKIIEETFL